MLGSCIKKTKLVTAENINELTIGDIKPPFKHPVYNSLDPYHPVHVYEGQKFATRQITHHSIIQCK